MPVLPMVGCNSRTQDYPHIHAASCLVLHDEIHERGKAIIASGSPGQYSLDSPAWRELLAVGETLCAQLHQLLDR